jgi:hypothetical protein
MNGADSAAGWKALAELQYQNRQALPTSHSLWTIDTDEHSLHVFLQLVSLRLACDGERGMRLDLRSTSLCISCNTCSSPSLGGRVAGSRHTCVIWSVGQKLGFEWLGY